MKDLAQALCSNSKLIKLAVKPDGRKKTRFCDEVRRNTTCRVSGVAVPQVPA